MVDEAARFTAMPLRQHLAEVGSAISYAPSSVSADLAAGNAEVAVTERLVSSSAGRKFAFKARGALEAASLTGGDRLAHGRVRLRK